MEIRGRLPCIIRPTGTILLMRKLLQLVNKWLGFCRATLIAGVTIPSLPIVYLIRPGPRDSAQFITVQAYKREGGLRRRDAS